METGTVDEEQTPDRAVRGAAVGPIKIGTTLPLTGSLQAFGTSLRDGYKQAIDEVKQRGRP